jgi:DNA-binding GntR family transcriptional regulator
MDRVRFFSLSKVSPPENLIAQHYTIYAALEARDPDAAEQALRAHLQEMIFSITPIAEQNSEWFDVE